MSETISSITVVEMLQAADTAHQNGVPVDWRSLSITIFQTLSQRINELEQEMKELEYAELDDSPVEDEPDEIH